MIEFIRGARTAHMTIRMPASASNASNAAVKFDPRGQLANPVVSSIGPGLLAEARHTSALADGPYTSVAAPRRAAGRAMLQAAIDWGELPALLDLELAVDLLIAPLVFRMLIMDGSTVPAGVVDGVLGWVADGTFPPLREDALPEWYRLMDEARSGDLAVSVIVCSDPAAHQAPDSPSAARSAPASRSDDTDRRMAVACLSLADGSSARRPGAGRRGTQRPASPLTVTAASPP